MDYALHCQKLRQERQPPKAPSEATMLTPMYSFFASPLSESLRRLSNTLSLQMGDTEPLASPDGVALRSMGPDLRTDLMRMTVIAVGFGIAVWIVVRLLHRLTTQKDSVLNEKSLIKFLDSRVLGPRAKLYLIEIPGKRVLIAQTPTELRPLAEASSAQSDEKTQSSTPSL